MFYIISYDNKSLLKIYCSLFINLDPLRVGFSFYFANSFSFSHYSLHFLLLFLLHVSFTLIIN